MSEAPRGILVAAPVRWDEAAFAVPAIRAMANSGLLSTIICREEQKTFWETVTPVQKILYSGRDSVRTITAKLTTPWQAALIWEPGTVAKAITRANIPKRLGPNEPALAKILTHPLPLSESPTEHRVRRYLKTCEQMGLSAQKPEYFAPASLGIQARPNSILLCPGSDFGQSHEWPLDRWQELAEHLLAQGKQLSIAGLISERAPGKTLHQRLGPEVEFLHAAPLSAALPLLAKFQIVIAADGSLPHLAAHVGATCLTLFGPNDTTWKRPLGTRHNIVKRHVECAPCLSPKCLMDFRCQNELETQRVIQAIPKSF